MDWINKRRKERKDKGRKEGWREGGRRKGGRGREGREGWGREESREEKLRGREGTKEERLILSNFLDQYLSLTLWVVNGPIKSVGWLKQQVPGHPTVFGSNPSWDTSSLCDHGWATPSFGITKSKYFRPGFSTSIIEIIFTWGYKGIWHSVCTQSKYCQRRFLSKWEQTGSAGGSFLFSKSPCLLFIVSKSLSLETARVTNMYFPQTNVKPPTKKSPRQLDSLLNFTKHFKKI